MDSNGLYYKLFHSQNVNDVNPFHIYNAAKSELLDNCWYRLIGPELYLILDDKAFIQKLRLQKKLPVHNGCVCFMQNFYNHIIEI